MAVMPNWVTKQLLENALRQYTQNETLEILFYENSAAIPVGENYTSNIFRTSITYKSKESENQTNISVIVKCSPQNEKILKYAQDMRLFETEACMFTKIFPALSSILGENLCANCVFYTNEPEPLIIFQDLSTLCFQVQVRQHGLDLEHCFFVMEKLASLHAASAVLHKKQRFVEGFSTSSGYLEKKYYGSITTNQFDPTLMIHFKDSIFRETDFSYEWIRTGFRTLIRACSRWPGYEKYSKKLKKIQNETFEKTLNATRRVLNEFNILNHGDAWINNFMFKYGSKAELQDFRFVDLQTCVNGSPTIDLNYFWATSPSIEVQKQHFDTVLNYYYDKLLSTLTRLQYPLTQVPTQEELRRDFNSRAFFGLATCVTVLPIVTAPKRDDATFEGLLETDVEEGFQQDAYNCGQYREHMEYLLNFYDNLGILD